MISVEGLWQGQYEKGHVLIYLSHILPGQITCYCPSQEGRLRDYYITFSISALVLARDSHIKPDSEATVLIWVEGWYQGRYGKFHVIIFLSHNLHWPFPSIDFYIAKKIFELTNYENKFLRELPLFKYFCFESGFKNTPSNVDLYNDVRNCL
jgi:hypothetical protein